jgi:hypothetical protein
MENINPIEDLNDNLKEYLNTRYELMVLKASEKISVIGAAAVASTILVIFATLFILFGSLAAGFFLAAWTGSYGLGFLILAGIYASLFAIVMLIRKTWIIRPLRDKLIQQMFDEN